MLTLWQHATIGRAKFPEQCDLHSGLCFQQANANDWLLIQRGHSDASAAEGRTAPRAGATGVTHNVAYLNGSLNRTAEFRVYWGTSDGGTLALTAGQLSW